MSKHTPGPWRVGNVDPLLFGQPQENGTQPLGFVYGPSHAELSEHGRECLANALLCAAAPDLLEALNDLLEAADSMRGTYGCIQGRHPEEDDTHIHDKWAEAFLDERATLARAAIAKATGSAT